LSTDIKPFTIAIAGFGWWGKHMATRLEGHPFLRVAGIVEPFEANHAAIAQMGLTVWTDLDEALAQDDVEAVILTTPNPLHEEQVIKCAQAGKHVFCEKPLGLTAASATRSVAACKTAGIQLGIGHERRFETALAALKADIDANVLGTIMHAEAAFSHDKLINVPKGDWRTSKAVSPAAGMTAMGIHLTDLLISYFGRVKTVQAMTASRSLGWETGDVVTVQLGFEAGMTATLSAVLHTPHFIRMHVFGTDKWVEVINNSHPDTPDGTVRVTTAQTGKPLDFKEYAWSDAVTENLEAFCAACQDREVYPFTLDQMVHNIEVLEAITLSAEDRRTIEIAELTS
jgi:predicted dehydrogenase